MEGHLHVAVAVAVQVGEIRVLIAAGGSVDGLREHYAAIELLLRKVVIELGSIVAHADAHIGAIVATGQGTGVLDGAPGAPVIAGDIIIRGGLLGPAGRQAQHQTAQQQEKAEFSHGLSSSI